MDYTTALAKLTTARDIDKGKPLGKTTRLYACKAKVEGITYRAVTLELHATYIVTMLENGWYILNTGGWDTITTWRWINDYAPGHYYSDGKGNKHVGSPIGYTAARVTKCRMCKGEGRHTHIRTGETWYHGVRWGNEPCCPENLKWEKVWVLAATGEPLPVDSMGHLTGMSYQDERAFRDAGIICQMMVPSSKLGPCRGHYRYFPEPEVTYSECYRCRGKGRANYGSKPIHIPFEDWIVVDAQGEWVADCGEVLRYESDWVKEDNEGAFLAVQRELLHEKEHASVA